GNFYGKGTLLDGPIVVTAPSDKPFWCYANQQSVNPSMTFQGAFSGAEDTGIVFNRSEGKSSGNSTNTVFAFSGSFEEFYGNMDLSVHKLKESDHLEAIASNRCVTMRILATMPFNGTLHLNPSTVLELSEPGVSFTAKNLSLKAQSKLIVGIDVASPRTSAALVVTNALSLPSDGRVALELNFAGDKTVNTLRRHPLMTVPANSNLTLENFREYFKLSSPTGYTLSYQIEANGQTGLSTFYAVQSPIVTLQSSDGSKISESFSHGNTENIKDVTKWSNGEFPKSGFSYLVDGKILRTPSENLDSSPVRFLGDTLTLRTNATLQVRARWVEINNLYIESLKKETTITYLSGGTNTLNGNFYLLSQDSGCLTYELAQDRTFIHNEKWIGSGKVVLAAGFENQTKPPQGTHKMNAASPDFSGVVHMAYKLTADKKWTKDPSADKPADGTIVPNWNQCCRVEITDPMAFGVGPRGVTNHQAIIIEDYSILKPLNDIVLDNPCRGWSIQNKYAYNNTSTYKSYGAPVARFEVPEGVTMTFKERLDFNADNATLVKEGIGCLALGGFEPTFWGGNDEPTATANNNIFRIREGSVKPLNGKVTEALQVFVANDARFVFEADPADPTLKTYGLLNSEYRKNRSDRVDDRVFHGKPLQCEEGSTKINIEIVDSGTDGFAVKQIPLFTLGAEYIEEVAGLLNVTAHPYADKGLHAEIVCGEPFDAPDKLGGQLVTISVRFTRGFTFVVR
ncbi:MAG: hypothetical protein IKJ45_17215, partial [Kiritimatiellae bacterium]|nr:hypothetical protein [Kiritimatiellia bacterium]